MAEPLSNPPARFHEDEEKELALQEEFLRVRDRMCNIEQRYLNQDGKLDAILSRQTEYRRDMREFREQMDKKLATLETSIALVNQFSWFIDTINNWRNNLFWGVAKFVLIVVCIVAFLSNSETMRSSIKKLVIGL